MYKHKVKLYMYKLESWSKKQNCKRAKYNCICTIVRVPITIFPSTHYNYTITKYNLQNISNPKLIKITTK